MLSRKYVCVFISCVNIFYSKFISRNRQSNERQLTEAAITLCNN